MSDTKKVKLYYLGGLCPPGEHRPVTGLKGAYMLPDVGDYIEIEDFVAADLIRKHKVFTQQGAFDAFTLNAHLARAVKNGTDRQESEKTVIKAATMSDDDLLNELRSRGLLREPLLGLDEEVEQPVAAAKAKK